MVRFTSIAGTLALALRVAQAAPHLAARQLPDPSGAKNVGNGQAIQFVGGQCNSGADCASQCCAGLLKDGQTIGVCSGPGAQFQAGKQGCGFVAGAGAGAGAGAASPAPPAHDMAALPPADATAAVAASTSIPSTLEPDPAGNANTGNAYGKQFIGGQCLSDKTCASGCCALVDKGPADQIFGICSGPLANFQDGKQGCGFPFGGGSGITPVS